MIKDVVTVSTVVATTPAAAFRIFCDEIDLWWRRSPNYRARSDSIVRFAGLPARKLVEVTLDGRSDLGEVTRWEPPNVLAMTWYQPVGLQPAEINSVEVRFDPVEAGTRVTITHSGWIEFEPGGAGASVVGLWWSNLLVDYRATCDLPAKADS